MKFDKIMHKINESKFAVGDHVKMIPEEGTGVRPIAAEIIQVLSGRCKIKITEGKRKDEEKIVWNTKLIK